ncbi:MAG: pyruvate kinase [Chlamydiales bacterium]|nr:pyruvate kinase [Chlamydiales bacterium]
MRTRTKIICTMGPAVSSYEKILEMIDAGMNVARINFSHGTHADHQAVIEKLKKAREQRKMPLAIMLDTKGPEIRLGKMGAPEIPVTAGKRVLLVKDEIEGDEKRWQITPSIVLETLKPGVTVLFDDGYISSKVVEKSDKGVLVEIQNSGVIKSFKGVNIPGVFLDIPAMTEQDVQDIIFGCKQDVDIIAASFIRSADHVLEIKQLLEDQGKADTLVIAKIENSLGVQNFESIVQVADGIMVARGDLGVEMPLKQVPSLQKMMISKCIEACKPVVTATQMLESMIKNPRPTRAEVSDVANAIYDSTSAVMLSGETAVGQYPIEAISLMRSIAEEAERNFDYREFFERLPATDSHDISSSVSLAAVKTAYSAKGRAIFAFTNSGFTARLISRFRPQMPIIALTPHKKTYNQMAFNWGVVPVDPAHTSNVQEAFSICRDFAMKRELVQYGDLVTVTAGSPFGMSGSTNMMLVESVGDVLLRGDPSEGAKVEGKITIIATSSEQKRRSAKDRIALLSRCDESYLSVLKGALAIILQNLPTDRASEKHAARIARELDIPLITRAEGAAHAIPDGLQVTIDPEKGIVYKGSLSL